MGNSSKPTSPMRQDDVALKLEASPVNNNFGDLNHNVNAK